MPERWTCWPATQQRPPGSPLSARAERRHEPDAQRLGFSLDEVTDLLQTSHHQHRGQPDEGLRQRATAKLAEVEAKVADLSAIADTLRAALDAGCTDLIECAGQPQCPLPFAALAVAAGAAPATRGRSK